MRDMTKRNVLIGGRFFFGLLTLVAVGTQLTVHLGMGYDLWNFFSYFTNLSNIFAALVLLISGYRVLIRKRPSEIDDVTRGTATIAMAVVGWCLVHYWPVRTSAPCSPGSTSWCTI